MAVETVGAALLKSNGNKAAVAASKDSRQDHPNANSSPDSNSGEAEDRNARSARNNSSASR